MERTDIPYGYLVALVKSTLNNSYVEGIHELMLTGNILKNSGYQLLELKSIPDEYISRQQMIRLIVEMNGIRKILYLILTALDDDK